MQKRPVKDLRERRPRNLWQSEESTQTVSTGELEWVSFAKETCKRDLLIFTSNISQREESAKTISTGEFGVGLFCKPSDI